MTETSGEWPEEPEEALARWRDEWARRQTEGERLAGVAELEAVAAHLEQAYSAFLKREASLAEAYARSTELIEEVGRHLATERRTVERSLWWVAFLSGLVGGAVGGTLGPLVQAALVMWWGR